MTAPDPAAANPTAALLIIGDEILSGRTKDANLAYLATWLNGLGVEMREARVVPDIREEIVAAVNALKARFTYVFTTGGIGPTHDDITADCIAAAFGTPIGHRADAVAILEAYYPDAAMRTPARMRMARIPDGAQLIENPVSAAPGFQMENVFVMAGVPQIMQGMLESVRHRIAGGTPLTSISIRSDGLEGTIAERLGQIQDESAGIAIGSYPFRLGDRFGTRVVLRGKDVPPLEAAAAKVEAMLTQFGFTHERENLPV